MARSKRNKLTEVEFHDRETAERWLKMQPREISHAMAARAALRVLPFLASAKDRSDFHSDVISQSFRALVVAWAAASHPAHAIALRECVPNVDFEALNDSFSSSGGANDSLGPAAAGGTVTFTAYAVRDETAAEAATSASYAIQDSDSAFPAGDNYAWPAAVADANIITSGSPAPDYSTHFARLIASPLWLMGVPSPIERAWAELKEILRGGRRDYDSLATWYEDRLQGRPSLGQAFDLAVATLPDELWKQGPATVNARIKELIAEHSPLSSLTDEDLPTQTPRAAIFQPNATGAIDLAPPVAADRLADTSEVRDLYGETREKLDDLISLGGNMLGDRLDRSSDKLRSRMPENMSEAIERLVWSSGNTLRSILAGHETVAVDRDPHPDKLDQGVIERLRDVVDTFNQLAIADPALRLRDAGRPGPQEHARTLSEIEIVVEVVVEAANDRNITTREAGAQLSENAAIVSEAGTSLTNRLAVELARDTDRNFVAGVVVSVYRMLRSLPSLARGEGGFISKEYFSGFYKYGGGATAIGLLGAVVGAYSIRWEIVEFIVSNADQLRLYGAYAFEQSPGFKQMIDWLEAHVRLDKIK